MLKIDNILAWTPIRFDGWTNLTVLVMMWITLSAFASIRFLPRLINTYYVYRRSLENHINGGTVPAAAREQFVYMFSSFLVCFFCLAAGILAAHREVTAILFLVLIPIVKVVQSELGARAHNSLLDVIDNYYAKR